MSIYRVRNIGNLGHTLIRLDGRNLAQSLVILMAASFLIAPPSAEAYIDPGTGSYAIQLTYAGWLATAYLVSASWRRAVDFLKGGLFQRRLHRLTGTNSCVD